MKKLNKKFELIFEKYRNQWLNFYDDNPSDISKNNNLSFFNEIYNGYGYIHEIIINSIERIDLDTKERDSLEFEYFNMLKQYHPEK